ncbi:HNH endonuclease [Paenibacillus sp. JSM ZJ436]
MNQWKWTYDKCKGYAYRGKMTNKKQKMIYMHREVNKTPEKMLTDHVNGDKLDNRKENLRTVTIGQNNMNRHKLNNISSIYKGVKKRGEERYYARINNNKKEIYIGTFLTEVAAANAYNFYAKILFGKYASLNKCECVDFEQFRVRISKTSKYTGIVFAHGKWEARVSQVYLGRYETEKEALESRNSYITQNKFSSNRLKLQKWGE